MSLFNLAAVLVLFDGVAVMRWRRRRGQEQERVAGLLGNPLYATGQLVDRVAERPLIGIVETG